LMSLMSPTGAKAGGVWRQDEAWGVAPSPKLPADPGQGGPLRRGGLLHHYHPLCRGQRGNPDSRFTIDTLWAVGCCWELPPWGGCPPYTALQALTVDHVPQPQLLAVLHN
jgi:hypothetical protein